mmetsp:Transcript_14136/g.30586  ORF Transcript_14136/g.30586 Transcript_14136/m.30586 type:complete len:1010 (-) Transcript_14136:2141-5170(-)
MRVATSHDAYPAEVRLSSAIMLKNVVCKYWAKQKPGADGWAGFSQQDKAELRQALLSSGPEPRTKIASQLNLAIAKIARCDWPQKWGQVFSILSKKIGEPSSTAQRIRSLQTLLSILKELNTRRLPAAKKQFQSLSRELVGGVRKLWTEHIRTLVGGLSPALDSIHHIAALENAEVVLWCSKVLHLLVVYGTPSGELRDEQEFVGYLQELCESGIQEKLASLSLECKSWQWTAHVTNLDMDLLPLARSLTKASRALLRTIIEVQEKKTVAFAPFLGPFLERGFASCVHAIENRSSLAATVVANQHADEKLSVLRVTFISNVLNCREYRSQGEVHSNKLITSQGDVHLASGDTLARTAGVVVQNVFTAERVGHLTKLIIQRALTLTPEDIDRWIENPEEYAVHETELSPTMAFRPACENLLTILMDSFQDVVAPFLVQMLGDCERDQFGASKAPLVNGSQVSPAIALRDSMYLSVGLCSYWLHKRLPFREFLEKSLFPVLNIGNGLLSFEYDVLRRRILWLLGCITSEIDKDLQQPLYDFLIGIIEAENVDLLVRITAATAFNGMIESWDFVLETFLPFRSRAVRAILKLSSRCETSTARLNFMRTLINIVDRLSGQAVLEIIGEMLGPVERLWGQSSDAEWSLWKIATLELFGGIVEKVAEDSEVGNDVRSTAILELQNIFLPLISFCLNKSNDEFHYLVDPGTHLWAGIAKSTTNYTEQLHQMFAVLPDVLMGNEAELFPCAMDLLEAHTLFAANELLKDYGERVIVPLFQTYLLSGKLKAQHEARLLRTLEILVRAKSPFFLPLFSGLLQSMAISACSEKSEEITGMLLIGYLSVLARVLFEYGTQAFAQSVLASNGLITHVIDCWLKHFDKIGSSAVGCWRRKLWVIVLCAQVSESLVAQPDTLLRDRLSVIIDVWTDVHSELSTPEQCENAKARLLDAQTQGTSRHSNLADKKLMLFNSDPVSQLDLKQLLRETMQRMRQKMDEATMDEVVRNLPEHQRKILEGL